MAVRGLRRAPTFSAVAIITIALGIGSTTAIFTVLDGVVLKPLPYDAGDRVMRIEHTASERAVERLGATNAMYFHYGEYASTLDAFALYLEQSVPLGGETDGDVAREAGVIIATPSLFSILGVTPALGRLFTEDEIQPGVDDVAVLSHQFWMTRYGGDSTVIGKPLSDNVPVPIVGVLPAWFDFIRPKPSISFGSAFERPDIYVPLTLNRATARFGNFMYQAVGRLAPGVSPDSATRELTTLMLQMPTIYPDNGLTDRMVEEGGFRPVVTPLKGSFVGSINFVGPGYLETIGATLLQGREFDRHDYVNDPDLVVVNRTFAQQRWPGEDPIDKRLVQWPAEQGTWYRVVGVVADIRESSLAEEPEPMVYLPTVFLPGSTHGMFVTNYAVVIQTSGDPRGLIPAIQREITQMGSVVPITNITTLDELKAASMQQLSFAMVLLVVAGSAAMLLGVVGIYGVVAYIVSQRTREIGLRLALGAQNRQVRGLVLRQGGAVAAIGVAFGLVGAAATSRLLRSMLFGVTAVDLTTYAVTSAMLTGVVLVATLVPAQRAAALDPLEALRSE